MAQDLRMEPVHDFAAKLRQPALYPRVLEYVAWQRAVRAARARGEAAPPMPEWAPLSLNLDLTTGCNYACDHCVDFEILNQGVSHDDRRLREAVREMAARGLRSVILIGGGEPTVYPTFVPFVGFLKQLGLQVAVSSNGSRGDRLLQASVAMDGKDWIRLSLDAGTDATFQRMHHPKKAVTLDQICGWIPRIKAVNPRPRIGFSFLITWNGAARGTGETVVENLDEIPVAARRARDSGFDYIAFKPFLTRREDGAEVLDPASARGAEGDVVARIRGRVEEAKALATPAFRVVESTNLRVLESGRWRDLTAQPRTCHMQALRQVLTPHGLYNCPAHRGADKARMADREAYATPEARRATADAVAGMLDRFDAGVECREVTCLYHGANWWVERAVADGGLDPAAGAADGEDWFL